MTVICTIGHSNHPIENFLGLLGQHEIVTVIDVRSRPYSKWAPHFQKTPLSRSIRAEGIEYVFLGRELGGRPDGEEFYDAEGHVDYALRAQARDFRAGTDRLVEIPSSKPTAIMCAEENPSRCHRRLLITPALEQRNIEVVHVRGDGRRQSEEELLSPSPQLQLFQ